LSRKMSEFLSRILSDASGGGDTSSGKGGPGGGGSRPSTPRPPIPAADPPRILEFLSQDPLLVPEGGRSIAKFKSDARPPKYSFHGDNPRCFAKLSVSGELANR